MKFNFRIILLIIIGTIVFYSILLLFTDFSKIGDKLANFQVEYLPIILALVVASWMLAFKRWDLLLKNLGIKVPFRSNFPIFVSSFAVGITPARIGHLFKSQMLKNRHNIPRTKTAPLVFIERFYDLIGGAITASIGILFFTPAIYVIILVAIIIGTGLSLISSRKLFDKFLNRLTMIKFLKKFAEPLSESYDVLRASTRGRIALYSTSLTVGHWLLVTLAVYFTFLAYNITSISFLETIPLYLSSVILGAMSFVPGGVGVSEASLAGFLALLDVDLTTTLTVSILVRILVMWSGVIVGFIALRLVRDTFEEKNQE